MPRWAILYLVVLVIAATLTFALPVSAGLVDNFQNPCDACVFAQLLANIKNIVVSIAGSIAVLMIIIGGVIMTVSAGNENLRTQGKKAVTGGIIGLVIVLIAWAIVVAIITSITGAPIPANLWDVTCPDDTTCQETEPTTPGEPGEKEFGGTLSGSRAGASSALSEFLNCFDDYIPEGETWIITSVTDNSHPSCRPNNDGNPLGCSQSQCICGSAGKHCPDSSCDSCGSYCSHAYRSCHYGGTCTDGSYAIDMDTTGAPPDTGDINYAAQQCGGAYILHHGSGTSDHVHMSIGSRSGCGCN